MSNYWLVPIWLALAGGFLSALIPRQQVQVLGKKEYRWSWFAALALAIPYVVWAGNRAHFGDTEVYRRIFWDAPQSLSQLSAYVDAAEKDKGFSVLTVLLKCVVGDRDRLFFLMIAAFQMLCLVAVYRKYSVDFWTSMFLFLISTDYFSWVFNGMRQFVAVTMVFACFGLIVRRKYVPVICVILLASTIHASALIMIPVIFIVQGRALNWKPLLCIALAVIAIALIDRFTPLLSGLLEDTQYGDMIMSEEWANSSGTNLLRVLVYSIPALLAAVGKRYLDQSNDPVIHVSANAALISASLYVVSSVTSGIFIGRLPIYTTLMSYIALPWLIEHMFNEKSAKIIKGVMVCCYLFFYYYQMHMVWNVL